jgi:uncharacterized protein (TIGR03084 family)
MPPPMSQLLGDLAAETRVLLEAMLQPLPAGDWERPTPAEGWAIRDQVSHLAYFDETASMAATDPETFRADAAALLARGDTFTDEIADCYRSLTPVRLLAWFHTARQQLIDAFAGLDPAARLPWYGPEMSAASAITARIMETWAHGQDIADALGIQREPTARLRHVAHLGVATFAFAYALRGREVPTQAIRVELTTPDGGSWTWGPEGAENTVTGAAEDFCLVVTQRRHRADTTLATTGATAGEWLSLAQAFAGPPGPGRPPRRKEPR